MCGTSISAVLLRLVVFFGASFAYVNTIDDLFFAAAVGGIAVVFENIRTVGIKTFASMVLTTLSFRSTNFVFLPREHAMPCVDNGSEHADNTDNATTVPSSTSSSR